MRILYVTLGVVFFDQITKLLVKGFSIPFLNFKYAGMYHGQRNSIIGDFFQLTFVENPGMAFGFDFGNSVKIWLSLFSIVASIGLFLYLYSVRKNSFSLRFALALILGGAIGNLIDRVFYGVLYGYDSLFYGKVVDFFDFDFFNFELLGRTYDRWPIFNIADMSVSIGVLILLLFYRKHQKETSELPSTLNSKVAIETNLADTNILSVEENSDDTKEEKIGKENKSIDIVTNL